MNYYRVLGVAQDATVEEIERAYRALARKVHPDRNAADAVRADERMKQLNQIRDTLIDPLLRAAYDDRLATEGAPRPPVPEPTRPAPRPQPAEPRASTPPPRPAPYRTHPHVAPFLRTHDDRAPVIRVPRSTGPGWMIGIVVALAVPTLLLWPREKPLHLTLPPAAPRPAPKREQVVVIRGDTTALRRAVRKTAKVVPVGATFDDVIQKFGPPDEFEKGANGGDLVLIYGKVRVELRDGLVVGGSP